MILLAMCDNVRGPFIPTLKKEFMVNNKGIAAMITACSLGFVIFTFVGGILCEKIGQKKVFMIGFIFIIFSLTGLHFCNSFATLIIELFLLNIGQALIAMGANTIIPVLAVSFQAIIMNLTHFCYGLGATFTQRFTGIMLHNGVTWKKIYLIIAIISFIIFIGFMFVEIPETHKAKQDDKINHSYILKNKLIYFYMIALGFYVAAEINTGNWFINFMYDVYNFNENQGSFYTALFFGTFTIGRLLGGFVVEKFGYIKTVLISIIIAFLLYIFGLFIGESGIIIISVSGLFFAITFPTIVLTISKVFKNNVSYITGLIVMVASCIAMIINILIGTLNDAIGVYKTYYIIPICLLICVVFTYLIYINTKEVLIKNERKQNV
ncbi:MFS transporter [Clostridium aestuarii]|uniref:MFS transporter n=1 Tax=Clostridium aestuarii TaxID=338193 RepID=A0ABT4D7C9_9CLOT|nr:MFS transporter [Clostridium aestuarii]MCY6485918.1 MFS transporter [Clostridium aestuarii]